MCRCSAIYFILTDATETGKWTHLDTQCALSGHTVWQSRDHPLYMDVLGGASKAMEMSSIRRYQSTRLFVHFRALTFLWCAFCVFVFVIVFGAFLVYKEMLTYDWRVYTTTSYDAFGDAETRELVVVRDLCLSVCLSVCLSNVSLLVRSVALPAVAACFCSL